MRRLNFARSAAYAGSASARLRYGLSLAAVTALLAGCGGSQPPLSVSPQGLAPQQSLPQNEFHIIHPFGRATKDGANPAADLIDVKGTLYGTTVNGGGSNNRGTVFSITTSGEEKVLHRFGGTYDGDYPVSALLNVNGTLYGTTSAGGNDYGGAIFKIMPSGTEAVLHSFTYLGNGNPRAALINVGDTLYGTTAGLEGYWCGEVFSITTGGKFKILHSFGKGSDGCSPLAPLLNVNGTLYGTTSTGGNEEAGGTVFTISTTGKYQRLYNFGTNPNDGAKPAAALINVQGTLYGTTTEGGDGSGTVFSITTDGSEKVVHSFSGSDGRGPAAALKNVKGILYGTTQVGGANNLGTVFSLTKSGEEKVLHSFAKGEGVNPAAGVIAVNGTLYGTTYGAFPGRLPKRSFGNVFSLTP
jgi:uncharacterized repeat protein (TIGR03803 family)